MQTTTAEAPPAESTVDVEVLVNGLVHDQVARHRGDTIRVSSEEAEAMAGKARVKLRPMVRCHQDCRLIGDHVFMQGEEGATFRARPLATELDRHRVASIIDADELGIQLPSRIGRSAQARTRNWRGAAPLMALHLMGLPGFKPPQFPKGADH